MRSRLLAFLAASLTACGSDPGATTDSTPPKDSGSIRDGGVATDSGGASDDASIADAEPADLGSPDTGVTDASVPDAVTADATPPDLGPSDAGIAEEAQLAVDVVATGLEVVWEIQFLPSGDLLVTERPGRVSRVDPSNGNVTVLGTLPVTAMNESGLLGLAISPTFNADSLIYVCYTYSDAGDLKNRISRVTIVGDTLQNEEHLINDIGGNTIHDGCRLGFAADGTLYATMGDANIVGVPQDPSSLNGKILRLNPDGSIPADNPTPGSYVFSLGHRNPQGLAFHPATGVPFVTEHGTNENDEINRILPGKNYGFPMYLGAPGVPGFEDAIYFWTPTIAPAGATFYDRTEIPGWYGSLLLVTLKQQDLRRLLPGDSDFTSVAAEEILFDGLYGRIRAVRVGPDGWVYLGTSTRDGRGSPGPDDDRVLRVRFEP